MLAFFGAIRRLERVTESAAGRYTHVRFGFTPALGIPMTWIASGQTGGAPALISATRKSKPCSIRSMNVLPQCFSRSNATRLKVLTALRRHHVGFRP